jgi:hypothetical protein
MARTARSVANLGANNTNCTASNKFDLPLPFRPMTQFVVGENGWISGCCRNDRKFEIVICLICIALFCCYCCRLNACCAVVLLLLFLDAVARSVQFHGLSMMMKKQPTHDVLDDE